MRETDNLLAEKIGLFAVEGLGPMRYRKLMASFGSPGAVFSAGVADLEPIVGEKVALAIKLFDFATIADDILFIQRAGIRVIGFWENEFPLHLAQLDDSPALLFVLGDPGVLREPGVAVVGTRHPTSYGRRVAEELGSALARAGVTLISGGALGIDGTAHWAALRAGGKTVAVLGSGHRNPSPSSHIDLFARIADAGGAVVSEFLPSATPEPGHFPRRNRIISGLSWATVIVEGDVDSGAMITAQWAINQGKEVYAVPGSIFSEKSRGTNHLISQGAFVYTGPEVLLGQIKENLPPEISPEEQPVFEVLKSEPMHVDEIAEALGVDPPQALSVLLSLEIKGAVRQLPGKFFVRER
ncbi:MAG: DNA-processing protein DprA [candidate division WOR-3 bacterium]